MFYVIFVGIILFLFILLFLSIYKNNKLKKLYETELTKQKEILDNKEKIESDLQNQNLRLERLKVLYESLLELSRKIQSIENFEQILDEVSEHLEKNFGIKYYLIMKIDEEKLVAYYLTSNMHKKLNEEQFRFITSIEGLDLKKGGVHFGVYKHKKPLYLKRFRKSANDLENELIERLNLKSVIIYPLVYEDKCYGLLDISHPEEMLDLSKDEYLNLNIFLQYFSQIFRNHLYLAELKKQKLQLQEYNKKIIKKNQFIIDMNQTLVEINQKIRFKINS